MFFSERGLMNHYRTLRLKEIHKLPKFVMCSRNMPKLAMCGVTYVNVSFHIRVSRVIFQWMA